MGASETGRSEVVLDACEHLAHELARIAFEYPGGERLLVDLSTGTAVLWGSEAPPAGAYVLSLEVPADAQGESPGDLLVRCRDEIDAEWGRMEDRMLALRLEEME